MSYYALSCFPTADCLDGSLVLNENRESLPLFGDVVLVLGSTLLYPALLATTALSELYLAVDWSIHKYKHWSLEKRITKIESDPDGIKALKNQRLKKLEKRKAKQEAEKVKTLDSVRKIRPDLQENALIEEIKEEYKKVRQTKESSSLSDISARIFWEEKLKVIRAYERTVNEIECYNSLSADDDVRQIFLEKYKFLQLRYQLNQHIDCHYLRNLLIIQIPIIGLIYLSHSKYTAKTSLEKTDLVGEYNSSIKERTWFKPY